MSQDRRSFVKLLAALAASPAIANATYVMPSSQKVSSPSFSGNILVSAFDDLKGQHYVGAYDLSAKTWLERVAVSRRYHSGVARFDGAGVVSQQLVFVARRPGNLAVVLDLTKRQVIELTAAEGRHFFGHAAVDADNRVWFTENDYVNGRSLLVARSGSRLETVDAEIDLQGIGPHEFRFLKDGRTAVIGLGGIETHPDFPRKKLNLDTMQSEILLVDTKAQQIIDRDKPLDPQLSLRHLDVAAVRDQVVIAAQYQGPKYEQFPLVYHYQVDQGLKPFDAPESVWQSMNQYIASVQINEDGSEVLVTCPRSNLVHLFSLTQGKWLSQFKLPDPGGACTDDLGRYLVSTGTGQIVCLSSNNGVLTLERDELVSDTRWDNHMDRVVVS
ncbi:DUF1513 domain-containing protein [Litoribrevibacter albus]|uniref:DUF1513 domain-containing protein n=1 Tax=Litoribrevibacter albus TaxID=1473156 RepID=A0AA37W6R3_9GAMM|nr:DUF1513 domain-containing protein [Litoribrevibacter albus]GLQ29771.1 hypothetical protein GCM10007876_02490 [Litoribrevibacter albus]